MKIKSDFVTNSSSTSFILDVKCSGFLPLMLPASRNEAIGAEQYRKLGKKTKLFIHKLFPNEKFEDCFTGSGYAHITFNSDYGDEEELETPLSVMIGNYWDHIDEDEKIIEQRSIVDIHMKAELIQHKSPAELYIIKILKNMIKASGVKVSFSSFYYCASPKQTGSGGWNGGDPMGKYQTTPELMLNETRCGMIVIKDNNFINYIKSLNENFGLMTELEKMLKIKPNAFHPVYEAKHPFERDHYDE